MPNNNQAHNNTITNLFDLLDDEQTAVCRIPLTQDFQQELGTFFAEQQHTFTTDKQIINFTGSYSVDTGEIFQIENYPFSKQYL